MKKTIVVRRHGNKTSFFVTLLSVWIN